MKRVSELVGLLVSVVLLLAGCGGLDESEKDDCQVNGDCLTGYFCNQQGKCVEGTEFDFLKLRCLEFCKVFERCSANPAEYDHCLYTCEVFDDPSSAAEYVEIFRCKENCVIEASGSSEECLCILKPEDGGPEC
jgi:hypothetical protein